MNKLNYKIPSLKSFIGSKEGFYFCDGYMFIVKKMTQESEDTVRHF